jgi:hypothetical protein
MSYSSHVYLSIQIAPSAVVLDRDDPALLRKVDDLFIRKDKLHFKKHLQWSVKQRGNTVGDDSNRYSFI